MDKKLGQKPPLLVCPDLAEKVGLEEAILLQQVHYWLNERRNRHQFDGKRWVHNTYAQWKHQFPFWSLRTIQRIILRLEKQGVLKSFAARKAQKTKFYTIDYQRLRFLMQSEEEHVAIEKGATEQQMVGDACQEKIQALKEGTPFQSLAQALGNLGKTIQEHRPF